MHKNCIFKLGCTFIVVMIQILCDKTFNYKRNPQPSDSENDEKANKKPDGTGGFEALGVGGSQNRFDPTNR